MVVVVVVVVTESSSEVMDGVPGRMKGALLSPAGGGGDPGLSRHSPRSHDASGSAAGGGGGAPVAAAFRTRFAVEKVDQPPARLPPPPPCPVPAPGGP